MNADKPLLTLAQVRTWQGQIDQLAEEIRRKTAEMASLTRRVETASAFIASLPDDEQISVETIGTMSMPAEPPIAVDDKRDDAAGAPEVSISGCILAAVIALGGAPKPSAIRRWVAENNSAADAKLTAQPAYLYTALMRHVHGRRLAKWGKGYRPRPSSPRGETGGVASPGLASVTSPLTTCGPSQAAPEAGGT